MAAGIETLSILFKGELYETLDEKTKILVEEINHAVYKAAIPAFSTRGAHVYHLFSGASDRLFDRKES